MYRSLARTGGISISFACAIAVIGVLLLHTLMQPDVASSQTQGQAALFSTYLPVMERSVVANSFAADVADYVTLPDDFPTISVTVAASGTADGYIFMSNHHLFWNRSRSYLLILDDGGEPVFYRRMTTGKPTNDFKLQPNGLLTYWDAVTEKTLRVG